MAKRIPYATTTYDGQAGAPYGDSRPQLGVCAGSDVLDDLLPYFDNGERRVTYLLVICRRSERAFDGTLVRLRGDFAYLTTARDRRTRSCWTDDGSARWPGWESGPAALLKPIKKR